jgi:hypothetical protein
MMVESMKGSNRNGEERPIEQWSSFNLDDIGVLFFEG